MEITATQVKELREKTGVGMMECKKALSESSGDMEKAIVWLRERGMSRAAKKADRVAADGMVEVAVNAEWSSGAALEVNCETDFVSKNPDFTKFAHETAGLALKHQAQSVESLSTLKLGNASVNDTITSLISTIGENLKLRRVSVLKTNNGTVAGYTHMGGRIGTLVLIEGAKGAKAQEVAKDVAMHIAAAAPRYLTSTEVDTSELEQEREIARKKLREENKPENMIEKILEGQMKKFFKEVCLVEQAFVKDPNMTVTKYVETALPGASIAGFVRYQLGEGIEKKQENFADEVAAQLRK